MKTEIELIESIVNNFTNGNLSDCKDGIREYAKTELNVHYLLDHFREQTFSPEHIGSWISKLEHFTNTIYRALLNH